MRALPILCLFTAVLQGCHSGTAGSRAPTVVAPQPLALEEGCPPPAESSVEQWLRERHTLCALSTEQKKARFQRLEQRRGDHTLRDHLQKLALASCQPELTPGLLRQALSDTVNIAALAQDQRELVALISALDQSARILEVRNEQLKADLERTINGIRDIEADIDDIHQNGGVR